MKARLALVLVTLTLPLASQNADDVFKQATPTAAATDDFGSEQPVERADMPTRGVIILGEDSFSTEQREHWVQHNWKPLEAKRWGRYAVRLTYTMRFGSLQTQFRFGSQALKTALRGSQQARKHYLGEVYIEKAGSHSFALFAPSNAVDSGLEIHELAFIPAPEGEAPTPGEDGSILLEAKNAITWSEMMRYEPKPEKNCLGYWINADDFAEWEFQVPKGGKYAVSIFHGCGGGNHGSEVAVHAGSQELKFTTQDTGGFQNWKEVPLGEVEFTQAGKQRLKINPLTKTKNAILDVQKVVLKPVS
jgi:hypothetical protein